MATARTVWKGSIQASILNILIKIYPAINASNAVHFNQLCPDCHGRIKQSIGCPTCNKALERSEVLKGYPVTKDKFVILTEEEIDEAHKEKTEQINVISFVEANEIDPVFYEDTYYLTPEKAGQDLFQIFVETLIETNKNALGKIIMRSKEHLILLSPYTSLNVNFPPAPGVKILRGFSLHYIEDLRTTVDIPDSDYTQKPIDPEMLKLSKQLVTNLSGKFDPMKYKDEYREIILKHVDAKAQGITIPVLPKKEVTQQVNLMDALKQAVQATATA